MPTTPPLKRTTKPRRTRTTSSTPTGPLRPVRATSAKTSDGSSTTKARRQAEYQQQIAEKRLEKERLARQQRIKLGAWIGGGVLVVALFVWFINQGTGNNSNRYNGTIKGVVTFANPTNQHVSGTVVYPQVPPVGGNHNQVWLNCGIYLAPVPNENAVHSLEHGAVWITYQPSLASKSADQLANLVRGHDHAILSPYPGIPAPVVASAWGVQLQVTSASDPRLGQFLSKYENSPNAPEQGGACSGGTGAPSS